MAAGLTDNPPPEFIDWSATHRAGKPGPFGPKQEIVCRTWSLLGPFNKADVGPIDKTLTTAKDFWTARTDWQPSAVTNAGWVYLAEYALKREPQILFAVCRLDAPKAGRVRLVPVIRRYLWQALVKLVRPGGGSCRQTRALMGPSNRPRFGGYGGGG